MVWCQFFCEKNRTFEGDEVWFEWRKERHLGWEIRINVWITISSIGFIVKHSILVVYWSMNDLEFEIRLDKAWTVFDSSRFWILYKARYYRFRIYLCTVFWKWKKKGIPPITGFPYAHSERFEVDLPEYNPSLELSAIRSYFYRSTFSPSPLWSLSVVNTHLLHPSLQIPVFIYTSIDHLKADLPKHNPSLKLTAIRSPPYHPNFTSSSRIFPFQISTFSELINNGINW
jgi:hypothetical protein